MGSARNETSPRKKFHLGACLLVLVVMAATGLRAELILESSGSRLLLEEGRIKIERAGALIVEVKAFEFNFVAPASLTAASRSGTRAILRAVYPPRANYLGDDSDLPVDIEVTAVAGGFRFRAAPVWATGTTVRLRDLGEHFFGLLEQLYPENRPSPDLRGEVVAIDVRGENSGYHENYASAWSAFFMTNRGYASFFDTFAKGSYPLAIGGETKLYHRTGVLDWYVFFGRDGDEMLAAYYKVIGWPKAPPLWALGPIGWRDENRGGAAEILEDVRRMTELRIPFTAWFVNRPYSDGERAWSQMNFNRQFAAPQEWIAQLRGYDLRFMSWVAPMTFGSGDFPGQFPGPNGYLDLSDPAAVQEFRRRLTVNQYSVGVQGHKMDRGEESFPETVPWKDGTTDNEARNKYVYLYAKVVHEGLSGFWGKDHVNFARGAFHRTQPYLSALWGGDARSSWAGLAGSLANAIRCGFMGFPVWGADTGGYLGGRIGPELYARWLQWGTWNGLFEIKLDNGDHSTPGRPPWSYDEKLQGVFRAECEQRMRLLPYIFSLAHTSGRTGVLMKPLAYVWPEDPATYGVWDEYLFGPALLIAPLTAPGGKRSVYLPAGRWFDYHNLTREFAGGQTVELTMPFDRIPVFVRANSVYVTGTWPLGNEKSWAPSAEPRLVLHIAPGEVGEAASFELVDKLDGERPKMISLRQTAEALLVTAPALGAGGEMEVRCTFVPQATLNGSPATISFDEAAGVARVAFAAGVPIALRFTSRSPD